MRLKQSERFSVAARRRFRRSRGSVRARTTTEGIGSPPRDPGSGKVRRLKRERAMAGGGRHRGDRVASVARESGEASAGSWPSLTASVTRTNFSAGGPRALKTRSTSDSLRVGWRVPEGLGAHWSGSPPGLGTVVGDVFGAGEHRFAVRPDRGGRRVNRVRVGPGKALPQNLVRRTGACG